MSAGAAWRLCASLDALFTGMPVEVALRTAREEGCAGVEVWDWRDHNPQLLQRHAQALGLAVTAFTGTAFSEPFLDPAEHDRALEHLRESLAVAGRLGAGQLVAHVGYALSHHSRAAQREAAVAGLRRAGDLAGAAGVMLLVEPLNSLVDHPGYFLDTLPDALALIASVNHPAVRLLLDVYHMWVMHGEGLDFAAALPVTAHVHVADVPGRGEPGSGTIPWRTVMQALRRGGYRGAIGLECWPTTDARAALRRSREVLAG